MTPEKINLNYNNFYEFSTSKHLSADGLKIRPWTVTIDGLVEKPQTFAIDDLIKTMGLEERLYRHRCVEAWSMAIPWTGFPLRALVEKARPLSSAKYVRFESFLDKKDRAGPAFLHAWPYIEGLTIAEATNDLAFMATGAYGKPLAKVQGAPIRLATPWKYGFKSAKSIVKISFVDTRPATFWETLGPDEYGFWANVNPDVPHPRWSQAKETLLTTGELRPTLLFNGYGEQVAGALQGSGKRAALHVAARRGLALNSASAAPWRRGSPGTPARARRSSFLRRRRGSNPSPACPPGATGARGRNSARRNNPAAPRCRRRARRRE